MARRRGQTEAEVRSAADRGLYWCFACKSYKHSSCWYGSNPGGDMGRFRCRPCQRVHACAGYHRSKEKKRKESAK